MIQFSRPKNVSLFLASGAIIISLTHAHFPAAAATPAVAPADEHVDAAANPYIKVTLSAPNKRLQQTAMRHTPQEQAGPLRPALSQPVVRTNVNVDPPTDQAKARARTHALDDTVGASHHHKPSTISKPRLITGHPRAIPTQGDDSAHRMWIAFTRQLLPLESSDAASSTFFDLPTSQPTYATRPPSFEPVHSIDPNDDADDGPYGHPPTPLPLPHQPTPMPVQLQPGGSVGSPTDHQHSTAPTLRDDDNKPSAYPDFADVTTLPPSTHDWSSPVAPESTAQYLPTYAPTAVDTRYVENSNVVYKPTNYGDADLPNYPPTDAPSFFRSASVLPSAEDGAYLPTLSYDASEKPIAPPMVSSPLPALPPSRPPTSSSTATPTQCPQPTPEPSVLRALRRPTSPTQHSNALPTSSSTATPMQCPPPTPEPSSIRSLRVTTTTPTNYIDSLPTSASTVAPTQCPQPIPEPSGQHALRKTTPPTSQNRNSVPTSSLTATPTQCPQPTPEPPAQRPAWMTNLPTPSPITTPTRAPTVQKPTRAPTRVPTMATKVRPATQIPTAEHTANAPATPGPTNEGTFQAPILSMPTTESSVILPTPEVDDPSEAPTRRQPTADAISTESPTSNTTSTSAVPPTQATEASSSTSQSSNLADNSAVIPFVLGIGGIVAVLATMALNARRIAVA